MAAGHIDAKRHMQYGNRIESWKIAGIPLRGQLPGGGKQSSADCQKEKERKYEMSSVIVVACAAGIFLGVALVFFAVFSRKKVPGFFTAVLTVVGLLAVLSALLLLLGVRAAN